jgi:hypothetical protein
MITVEACWGGSVRDQAMLGIDSEVMRAQKNYNAAPFDLRCLTFT